jgi:hypothetical protein
MLEVLTATGLASASGLNAGLPLLLLGAAARWTPLVELPVGWTWLSDGWVLAVLAVLVVLDVVADKVPGLDSLNDLVQSVVRPAAGGLAFGAGVGTTTAAVAEPSALSGTGVVVPVAIGVVLALVVHLAKALARPVVNATTLGAGGPVVSVVEDVTGVALSLAALLAPVLVVVLLGTLAVVLVRLGRRRGRHPRRGRTAAGPL